MTIKEKIMADVKTAMKNRESEKLGVLRFIHSALKNKEIEIRPKELTEEDALAVLKKLAKQRKDSIEQFENANRQDLADKEKAELVVLEVYLPDQMGKDQVAAIVDEAIAALGASSMQQMGAVMKHVLEKTSGTADNKMVSELVRAKLQ